MLLVTGVTGHSGKYFLKELINNNYQGVVRCIIRESSDTTLLDNSGLKIEKVIGDINDEEFINKSMIGIQTVMHIYNIHHSPMIVKASIQNKVKRAILVHTTGIYSEFKEASEGYKRAEKEVFQLIKRSDCYTKITILRPTMIYGDLSDYNMSKFIKMIDLMKIYPLIGGGHSLIQPVNARDLGKAYYNVLINPNETENKEYNLSGDRPISVREVLVIISESMNKKTIFISVPLRVSIIAARILKIITFKRIDIIEKVKRMGENRAYSHEAAKKDFGFSPMTFEEGIKIEINQYEKKHIIRC